MGTAIYGSPALHCIFLAQIAPKRMPFQSGLITSDGGTIGGSPAKCIKKNNDMHTNNLSKKSASCLAVTSKSYPPCNLRQRLVTVNFNNQFTQLNPLIVIFFYFIKPIINHFFNLGVVAKLIINCTCCGVQANVTNIYAFMPRVLKS